MGCPERAQVILFFLYEGIKIVDGAEARTASICLVFSVVKYGAGEAEEIAVSPVPTSSDNETGIRCEMGTEMLREMTTL
jgi:hypothetical protein